MTILLAYRRRSRTPLGYAKCKALKGLRQGRYHYADLTCTCSVVNAIDDDPGYLKIYEDGPLVVPNLEYTGPCVRIQRYSHVCVCPDVWGVRCRSSIAFDRLLGCCLEGS